MQTCTANADGCYVWSSPTTCMEGMVCTEGACACRNDCTDGQRSCDGDRLYECYYTPGGCFDWGMREDCSATGGTCDDSATPTCVGGAACGDGVREGSEACDGDDVGTETCLTQGYYGGSLGCTSACALDLSGCLGACGDEVVNGTEDCDGSALGGQTCVTLGFHGGDLGCTSTCAFDRSGCEGYCGDGEATAGEDCDGEDLGAATCQTEGFHTGTLACTTGCTLDTSGCSEYCGDGARNGPEACDGTDLGTTTCVTEGFYGGTVSCTGSCTVSTSLCTGFCGDGELSGAEPCDGTHLGTSSCADQGYYQGAVTCTAGCAVSYAGCSERCGDGVRNGAEICDDADLGGATCVTEGFASGVLSCAAGCGGVVTTGCLPALTVADCNLQSPVNLIASQGSQHLVYGRVRVPGLTDLTTGPNADARLVMQLGVGRDGTDPSTWTWIASLPNAGYSSPDTDEYRATLTVPSSTNSPYDFAYRVSGDAGATWRYCDRNGGAYAAADAGSLVSQPLPGCGNGVLEGTEACDGAAFGTHSCVTEGFYGGAIACHADCTLDLTGCSGGCGDGVKNGTEVCDGTDLGGATCLTEGYASGPLTCQADCHGLDTSACIPALTIGWCNLQFPTAIDATQDSTVVVYGQLWIAGQTTLTSGPDADARIVAQVGFGPDGSDPTLDATAWAWTAASPNPGFVHADNDEYRGTLTVPAAAGSPYDYAYRFSGDGGATWTACDRDGNAYTTDNTGDLIARVPPGCGNGLLDSGEACDGSAFGTETCVTQGYYGGNLVCTAGCVIDVSQCTGRCGDGLRNGAEACDATDLGGLDCADFGFYAGALVCSADCATIDDSGCTGQCGDAVLNGGEVCDATDLGGLDCTDYGFYAGTLACGAGCDTINPTACFGTCGDGLLNGPEACDGTDFGGLDCTDYGFTGGQLTCAHCAAIETAGCVDALAIGWCNTQWPMSISGPADGTEIVYGRLWIDGLTNLGSGPDPDARIVAEVGAGPDGSDPVADAAQWVWFPAEINPGFSHPADDEYQGTLTLPPAYGSPYDYAYRFSGDGGGTWTYCDRNGGTYDPADASPLESIGGLFFSEYLEGSSNNKAVELYNASNVTIDLDPCAIAIYSNGSATASATINLPAFDLAPGATYVVCHSSAVAGITDRCQLTSGSLGFNGNDAVALVCNGIRIDVFGEIGFDPGSAWGSGATSTLDRTLRRMTSVSFGDPDGSDDFFPEREWLGYDRDTFTGLGVYP
jgi:hypothetical protein